mmetsp:Transcript_6907/g.19407  ORF Transcript_6907/g.19407 Transcript_6907/m.19407 type:complete len:341 (+) Transcript_6907:1012-2034(+)
MEAISNGLVHENGGDGGVHSAADGADNVSVRADLLSHLLDELLGVVGHDPILLGTGNADDEVLQDVLAKGGVRHLGMELQAPHLLLKVLHGNEFGILGTGNILESLGKLMELVGVGHPNLELGGHAGEQAAVAPLDAADHGLAELPLQSRRDLAAVGVGELLHAVADPEDGDVAGGEEVPDLPRHVGGALLVDRGRSAAQDDGREVVGPELLGGNEAGVQLAVDVELADAAGDEVRVLAAEVEDCHLGTAEVAELGGLLQYLSVHFGLVFVVMCRRNDAIMCCVALCFALRVDFCCEIREQRKQKEKKNLMQLMLSLLFTFFLLCFAFLSIEMQCNAISI